MVIKSKSRRKEIIKYLERVKRVQKRKIKNISKKISQIPNKARVGRKEDNLHFKPILFNDGDITDNVTGLSICYFKSRQPSWCFALLVVLANTF
jgi:hypothetical protein